MKNTIFLWEFYKSPKKFQKIFNYNGGDEDYLVFIPHGVRVPFVFAFGTGTSFFTFQKDIYEVKKDGRVFFYNFGDKDAHYSQDYKEFKEEDTGKKLPSKWRGIWMVSGH